MLYEKLREQTEEFTAMLCVGVCASLYGCVWVCECECVSLVRRFVLLLSCPVLGRGAQAEAEAVCAGCVFMESAET